MRLVRTSFALEEVTEFLSNTQGSPLIDSYLVQYLLVSFYSEMEDKIKDIVNNRLSQITDVKVSYFVAKTNEGMLRRVKKAEINDVLQKFNCGEGDVIGALVGNLNLQPYFHAITNRHLVSHQNGTNMTLSRFAEAVQCGEIILDAVENALNS